MDLQNFFKRLEWPGNSDKLVGSLGDFLSTTRADLFLLQCFIIHSIILGLIGYMSNSSSLKSGGTSCSQDGGSE